MEGPENRSDSEMEPNFLLNPRSSEVKPYLNRFDARGKTTEEYIPRNYSLSSGIGSNGEEGVFNYEEVTIKEENIDGEWVLPCSSFDFQVFFFPHDVKRSNIIFLSHPRLIS